MIFRYDEPTNTASAIDLIDYHQEARNAHEEPAPSGRPDQNRSHRTIFCTAALGLNVSKAADILKVRRTTLSDLLRGNASPTPEMALRIEKAFGPDMDHLLRMQLAYDVAKTREHSQDISVERYVPA